MKRLVAILTTVSLALGGCVSDLQVMRIAPGQPAVGYPHTLRYSQFEIAVTWRVVSCKEKEKDPVTGLEVTALAPLKVKISTEIKPLSPLDPDHRYVIDPRSQQGLLRTTTFAMEWYEDRGTKSVNSSVDDQSGAVIVSALTGAARLAGLGFSAQGAGVQTCKQDVLDALAGIAGPQGESAVKKAQADLDEQTLVVSRLVAQIAAAGGGAQGLLTRLGAEQDVLTALARDLENKKTALKAFLGVVSDTRTTRWPEDGRSFANDPGKPLRPSPAALTRWGAEELGTPVDVYFALLGPDYRDIVTPATTTTPPVPASTRRSYLPVVTGPTVAINGATSGLPYREPRPMRLYVCSVGPCSEDVRVLDLNDAGQVVSSTPVQVFQASGMLSLPFQSRRFANINNSAAFAQSGVLTAAGSSQPRSAGATLATTFSDGAAQVVAGVQANRTAETARIKAEVDQLAAERALAEAQALLLPPTPTRLQQEAYAAQIAVFQTEATLASAERAAIEAQIALAAARALTGQ